MGKREGLCQDDSDLRNICTLLLTNTECPVKLNIVVLIIDKFVIHCVCKKEDLSDDGFHVHS